MNIRKLASLVLAILLLSSPALSLGESTTGSFLDQAYNEGRAIKTTVTFTPGTSMNLETDLAVAVDLMSSLRIETSGQKQEKDVLNHFTLFLQDKPALSATSLAKGEELHIMSSLLGDQTLSFTPEEFTSLFSKLLKDVPADTLNKDLKSVNKLYSYLTNSNVILKDDVSYVESLGFDPVNFQTDLVDPLTGWASFIMSNPKVTTGVFESEKHDTAVTKKEYAVSNEQLRLALHMIAAWAVQDENLAILYNMTSSGAGDVSFDKEEFLKMLLTMPNEFAKTASVFLKKPVVITEYINSRGITTALEIRADIIGGTASTLTAGKYIKTETDGISTLYGLEASSDDINISASFLEKDTASFKKGDATVKSSHWQAVLNSKQTGSYSTHFTLAFDGKTSANGKETQDDWALGIEVNSTGTVYGFSLKGSEKASIYGSDAKAEGAVGLYAQGINGPVCTINYTTASCPPEALPVIPGYSVHPGKMTDKELEAWGQEAYPIVMGQLMGLMSNLPPSILKLIFSSTYPQ